MRRVVVARADPWPGQGLAARRVAGQRHRHVEAVRHLLPLPVAGLSEDLALTASGAAERQSADVAVTDAGRELSRERANPSRKAPSLGSRRSSTPEKQKGLPDLAQAASWEARVSRRQKPNRISRSVAALREGQHRRLASERLSPWGNSGPFLGTDRTGPGAHLVLIDESALILKADIRAWS